MDELHCMTIYVGNSSEVVKVDGSMFDVVEDASNAARRSRIDDLFFSVAESAKENAVGVVLSGMLDDGVAGSAHSKRMGGECIVQDPQDAKFDSMPRNALDSVQADFVGTSEAIAEKLIEIAEERRCRSQNH